MTNYTVTGYRVLPNGSIRVEKLGDNSDRTSVAFRPETISFRSAEYGLDDPVAVLNLMVHEPHGPSDWDDPRDDPAVVAGWVTTTGPDSEPIWLYNARSTPDACHAHLARITGNGASVSDPDGHLTALAAAFPVNPALVRGHREKVDMTRWHMIYGALPVEAGGLDA